MSIEQLFFAALVRQMRSHPLGLALLRRLTPRVTGRLRASYNVVRVFGGVDLVGLPYALYNDSTMEALERWYGTGMRAVARAAFNEAVAQFRAQQGPSEPVRITINVG